MVWGYSKEAHNLGLFSQPEQLVFRMIHLQTITTYNTQYSFIDHIQELQLWSFIFLCEAEMYF